MDYFSRNTDYTWMTCSSPFLQGFFAQHLLRNLRVDASGKNVFIYEWQYDDVAAHNSRGQQCESLAVPGLLSYADSATFPLCVVPTWLLAWLRGEQLHLTRCSNGPLPLPSPGTYISCTALCHAEEKAGLLLAQIPWANTRWSPSTQLLSAADPTLAQVPCVTHLFYPSLTWETGNKLLVNTAWEQHLRQGKHKYFRSTWNLIIPRSSLCTWQLSQPQIWALSAHTMCSHTAIFNWHFPAKPQRFASDFFHVRAATNKASHWPT